ncbi:MAG TPA: hypothetical protein VMT93_00775, partial [Gemmatimonadaceae bacterium]|nr:hypothetical protein [Gemmatimonadaceae bacterium]
YGVAPEGQVAGRLPVDTTPAGLARGGSVGGVVVGGSAAVAAGAAAAPGAAAGAPVVGASAQEIEAMRRELATRKARLDSLQRALHENEARQAALGPPPAPGAAAAPRMSAADSAARAAEIEAIRQELNYRKARLDSLQKEVNSLGRAKKAPAKSDTTRGTPGGKPPRGSR